MASAIDHLMARSRAAGPEPWIVRRIGRRRLRTGLFLALLVALWAFVRREGWWPDYILPGPVEVGAALVDGVRSGVYVRATLASLNHLVVGYVIAAVGGVVFGALASAHEIAEDTIGAVVVGLQALPSICWLPLAILWFGLNDAAVVFVVVMGSLFSVLLGVERGIRGTPPVFVQAARVLGARGLPLYWRVVLPAAFPAILSGLKQGWAFAWRSLMAAELIFYSESLGNLLQAGRDLNDTAAIVAVMAIIVVIGIGFDRWLFGPLERRVARQWGHGVRA